MYVVISLKYQSRFFIAFSTIFDFRSMHLFLETCYVQMFDLFLTIRPRHLKFFCIYYLKNDI